jgi:hypothetical protein
MKFGKNIFVYLKKYNKYQFETYLKNECYNGLNVISVIHVWVVILTNSSITEYFAISNTHTLQFIILTMTEVKFDQILIITHYEHFIIHTYIMNKGKK